MQLAVKLKKILDMRELAIVLGCSRAEPMFTRDLSVDERVRMKCRLNLCGQYQQNLLCPPFVLDFADTDKLLQRYDFGMALQITSPADSANIREVFEQKKKEMHSIILRLEQDAFRSGFTFALGLGAGHCILCPTCAAREGGTVCCNPQQARPSLEALGLNVEKVCRQIGFPAGFIPGEVTVTGMLLID